MTLVEMRALVRLTLASATDWPNATLDAWIREAIRLYSAHFPRVWRSSLTLATGTQAYALPGGYDVTEVLSVEYPSGETPARYLKRVDQGSSELVLGGNVYAVRGMDTADSTAALGYLVFGPDVADGEYAIVEYQGAHALPTAGADSTVLTVASQHVEAITSFVEFCAFHELEADEATVVDGTTVILSQLGQDARRAWNRYKDVMDRLLYLSSGIVQAGGAVVWGNIGL